MKPRTKLVFKINNKIILEEDRDLYLNQIDELKHLIAEYWDCGVDDVDVEKVEVFIDISDDIDVDDKGMYFWKGSYGQLIQGVKCNLEEGSDEYLDAMNNGTLINHINFFI